jgi:RNA polymerase sigma-70 factor (ECF subfamily)
MIHDSDETQDVVQDVFIRFYQALGQFRGEAQVKTYLTRIAINLSLNVLKYRRRKRLLLLPLNALRDSALRFDTEQVQDSNEEVFQALQRLSPEFRSVVVLRLWEGYSTEETAKILGLPVGTVLTRLWRAQKKLQRYLR